MKYKLLGIVMLAIGMALAGVKTSLILPPSNLPQGTELALLSAEGKSLWKSGQAVQAVTVENAVYLEFALPGGKSYTYRVEHPQGRANALLQDLKVMVGKRDYTLITLLENRKLELGKDGMHVGKREVVLF